MGIFSACCWLNQLRCASNWDFFLFPHSSAQERVVDIKEKKKSQPLPKSQLFSVIFIAGRQLTHTAGCWCLPSPGKGRSGQGAYLCSPSRGARQPGQDSAGCSKAWQAAAPGELVQRLLACFLANSVALRASWMKPASVPRGRSCGIEAAQWDVLCGAVGSISGRYAQREKLC